MDNEFILMDRVQKIQQIITKYGEENFYISYSGGKDSTVLSNLIDLALPNNTIPRVYANTGIELNMIRKFVISQSEKDDRIIILKPAVNIKAVLENYGYPFKSKAHSEFVRRYQNSGLMTSVKQYLGIREDKEPWSSIKSCPNILRYQFTPEYKIKTSDKCCLKLKEEPIKKWKKANNKKYGILGLMQVEGGRRSGAKCLAFRGGKLQNFQPLAPLTKEWEEWFIKEYNVEICDIYKPPYNFNRTGCKGCPFNPKLQEEINTLEKFFPDERKQCEYIWKPIYDEYRRINYRLRGDEQ